MTKLKYCVECKYAVNEVNATWNLRCIHPKVNKTNEWSLSSRVINGCDCRTERGLRFLSFPACGMSGKLWEIRLDSDPKL